MGRLAEYTALITSRDGASVIADPIDVGDPRTGRSGWSEIVLAPRGNEAGPGHVQCTAHPDLLAAIEDNPDCRLVVRREPAGGGTATVEMAGPIEVPDLGFEVRRDGLDGPGVVIVRFVDDNMLLADRLVYPDPTLAATAQTGTRYTVSAANPEDAMRSMVDLNAGAGALAARQTPGLVLGTDNNLLPGVTVSTSFTRDVVLADALREIARLAGVAASITPRAPRFRILGAAGGLQFSVTLPADRSTSIIFSRDLGNVASLRYAPEAPKDTVAIVGDATAGAGRVIKERSNTAAHTAGWRRREVWVDARGAANAAELDQAGDAALADGGPRRQLLVTAVETAQTRYGYDFSIGDLVGVEPFPGLVVPAVVLGADISVTAGQGETITPLIGLDGDQITDVKAAELRRLIRRIAAVEGAL